MVLLLEKGQCMCCLAAAELISIVTRAVSDMQHYCSDHLIMIMYVTSMRVSAAAVSATVPLTPLN